MSGSGLAIKDLPGLGVTVQPARAAWTTGFFLEALYSRALEQLGYTVNAPKKLSNPIFYQSVYDGENTEKDIEQHVTEWIALNQEQWNPWIEEAKKAAE